MLMDNDPVGWEHDTPTGTYYRSPTDQEMTDYGWSSNVLLVIPGSTFVSDVVGATPTARIRVPIHDFAQSRPQTGLAITDIMLTKQWDTVDVPYRLVVEPKVGPTTRTTLHPKLSYYLPSGITVSSVPDRVLAVVSSSRGGLSVFGGAAYEQVHMRGPHTDGAWFDLELAPPGTAPFFVMTTVHSDASSALERGPVGGPFGGLGQFVAWQTANHGPPTGITTGPSPAASVTRAMQCDDGLDNDQDCAADEDDYNCVEHPDYGGHLFDSVARWEHSKDFALFGDLSFCSMCDGVGDDCSPETELMEYALTATSILNSVEPIAAYEPATAVPPFRMTMSGCLAIYDQTAQDDCDTSASCDLAGYPLVNTGSSYSLKLAKVWDLVDWAVSGMAASDRRPVHIAGILTDIIDGTEAEPGLAFVWNPNEPGKNGSLIVRRNNVSVPLGAGRTLAHEIGHTLGLDDDDPGSEPLNCEGGAMGATNVYSCSMVWPVDGNFYLGFMRQGSGFAPTLDWDDDSSIANQSQGWVWQTLASSKTIPRTNGFGWTSCNSIGHPGCSVGHVCSGMGVCI